MLTILENHDVACNESDGPQHSRGEQSDLWPMAPCEASKTIMVGLMATASCSGSTFPTTAEHVVFREAEFWRVRCTA